MKNNKENQLEVIVRESGLEQTKASYILEKFQEYFKVADEWAIKAKTIVVTHEVQTVDMKMARVGRLALREKRISIEKTRKELKEQSLREGKAIDGIANVLKALIVPIEEYLDQQEHFVEIKKKEEEEARRKEVERRMEEERIAEEKAKAKAEADERERIIKENESLRKEAEKKELQLKREREKARKEREVAELKAQEQSDKAAEEKRVIEEKARKEQAKAEAEKLEREAKIREMEEKQSREIECPHCHNKFIPEGQIVA